MADRTHNIDPDDPTTWPLTLCHNCQAMTRTTPLGACGKCDSTKSEANDG